MRQVDLEVREKNHVKAYGRLAAGILAVLLLFVLTKIPAFSKADLYLSDHMYQRGYAVDHRNIIVITMDEPSIEELGPIASWNRARYAKVLDRLHEEGCAPKVVGLDVIFQGSYDGEEGNESDAIFAQKINQYGNIVLAGDLNTDKNAYAALYPALEESVKAGTAAEGFTNITMDRIENAETDRMIRHVRTRLKENTSFAYEVAKKYLGDAKVLDKVEDVFYLRFAEHPEGEDGGAAFEHISFSDVYNGKIDPKRFDGRIVLIGPYASGTQDEWSTAIDHAHTMFGVDIQANIVNAFVDAAYRPLREVPDVFQYAGVAAILLLLWILALHTRLSRTLMIGAAFLIGGIGMLLYGREKGLIFHVLWLPVGIAMLLVLAIVLHYRKEYLQKLQIRLRFGRYVDPKVLKQILSRSAYADPLTGEEKQAAVLFVDICGFTTYAEGRAPQEVVALLNAYFDMVTEAAFAHGGIIDKFIGDAAMVVWNVLEGQEDYVFKAVSCAREMLRQTDALSKKLGFPVKLAIGIETGPVVSGNIGSSRRMDFTVIGDTVNTASRLESLKIPGRERGNQIYLSGAAYDAVAGRVEAEMLGEMALKGKETSIRIFQIKEEKGNV